MISIITPWHETPELIATYEPSVQGAEVVIVDNASQPENGLLLQAMADRLGGACIHNEQNMRFSPANNQGYKQSHGDPVIFLNSDISAKGGWLDQVEAEVQPGALYGPSLLHRMVGNVVLPYIEGFCIAATRETWEMLGLWPDDLPGMYWDDNIVCYRAIQKGIRLIRTDWPVIHFSNYTSQRTPGAYNANASNYQYFARMVQNGSSGNG